MTRGRERQTAPILSHGQTTSGQCGFNQAASHPADPIKRHRARRERSHPKAMLTTQTSAVALDLLENEIGASRKLRSPSAGTTPVKPLPRNWAANPWSSQRCVGSLGGPDLL